MPTRKADLGIIGKHGQIELNLGDTVEIVPLHLLLPDLTVGMKLVQMVQMVPEKVGIKNRIGLLIILGKAEIKNHIGPLLIQVQALVLVLLLVLVLGPEKDQHLAREKDRHLGTKNHIGLLLVQVPGIIGIKNPIGPLLVHAHAQVLIRGKDLEIIIPGNLGMISQKIEKYLEMILILVSITIRNKFDL